MLRHTIALLYGLQPVWDVPPEELAHKRPPTVPSRLAAEEACRAQLRVAERSKIGDGSWHERITVVLPERHIANQRPPVKFGHLSRHRLAGELRRWLYGQRGSVGADEVDRVGRLRIVEALGSLGVAGHVCDRGWIADRQHGQPLAIGSRVALAKLIVRHGL